MENNERVLLQNIFARLKSPISKNALFSQLVKTRILNYTPQLGSSANSYETVIQEIIDTASLPPLHMEQYGTAFEQSCNEIETRYKQQQQKAQKIFYSCLLLIIMAFLFLSFSGWLIFTQMEEVPNNGIIAAMIGVLTVILDKFLYDFYKREDDKAALIQKDLQHLQMIESKFNLIDREVNNEEARTEAKLKLITSL